eukprot:CAMPEP_0117513474 /NCGR_PEP_ID=MMETSP0784-20121206/29573_1 /TAXON_ID=39447 /ORGANISM="" /LENGTH=262 /DNA_ID=CAMNT_0005309241 /DNA_START=123 /DNA_END=908 /DNA_ORIENTATION=-
MDVDPLFCTETILPVLAASLDPMSMWQLRVLCAKARQALSQQLMVQVRNSWDTTTLPPLVEIVRAADPGAPPSQQKALLQEVGLRLLLHPESARLRNSAGQSAISWAADYGLSNVLMLLLSYLAWPVRDEEFIQFLHSSETNGWYPLYRAAWNGRTACVRQLLAAQADPEGAGPGRYSPLIAASRWGHEGAVAALLEAEADPTRKNAYGEDALTLARGQRHVAVVQLLQQNLESRGAVSSAEPDVEWRNSIQTRHTLGQGWW